MAAYRHDEAGNLVAQTPRNGRPGLSLGYDALGRPVMLGAGEDTISFAYDGLGRRVTRTDRSGTTRRVYDGASVIAELAGDEVLSLETTAGLLILARSDPSGTCHLHPDAGTNVAEVTDDGGRLLARYAYAPFGERTTLEGQTEAAGPLGFCGVLGTRREVGGVLDMRARLYHPGLGRFTSPDPWPPYLPEPVTLNRYLYALADPVSQVDPFGLFCWTGKSHGKCRGLGDVVERGREVLREAAPVVSTVATVASAVAVVAAGVSVVCPPCAVAGLPIVTLAGGVATAARWTGLAAVVATCVGEGPVTFDCAVGAGSRFVGGRVGGSIARAVPNYVFDPALRRPVELYGKQITGLFLKGTTSAAKMVRADK